MIVVFLLFFAILAAGFGVIALAGVALWVIVRGASDTTEGETP